MTRSQIDCLAYAALIAALAGCGSSKSPDESGSSHAAASGDESDTDAGPTDSTKTGAGNKADAGSATASKSDAGSSKGGQGTAAANNLPSDGNQLSLCSMAQGDCNKGLACSGSATAQAQSRDYCSKICETDEDCGSLTPSSAKYTCSTGRGTKLCEIACSGSDDASCPANLTCVQTGVSVERTANGGSGGASGPRAGAAGNEGRGSTFVPIYHCKYPLITSPQWGPCQDGAHQCDQDATCYGSATGRAGVCTKNCTTDSDCSEKPSSGSIAPTCATISAARGNTMETKLCVLSCLDKKDGCPDGTSCVDGPRAATGNGGMSMGRGMGRGQDRSEAGSGAESAPSYARCE